MFKLIPFFSYVFVVTFTPGPNNIMSMANAQNYGYSKTVKFMLGIFTGFSLIMFLCGYFNLLLFNIMPTIKTYMGIIGALYMVYLAAGLIKNNKDDIKRPQHSSFFAGMVLQLVNPKVILYGLTVMANFIIPYNKSFIILIFFSLLLAFFAFVSTSCWALFGVLIEHILTKYRRAFNIVMGLLLLYSAISISGVLNLIR